MALLVVFTFFSFLSLLVVFLVISGYFSPNWFLVTSGCFPPNGFIGCVYFLFILVISGCVSCIGGCVPPKRLYWLCLFSFSS